MLHQSQCGSGVSTPSATSCRLNASASPMIARTIARSLALAPRSRTNPRVDLERVDGKCLQMRQDGVTGAEVVDGDLDADLFQLRERSPVLSMS